MDVSLVSDTTFKYFFKHNLYHTKIIKVIKQYTNIDLTDYVLINNEINTGTKKIKDKRMDLIFKKDNHIVIIEMEQFHILANETKDYEYLYSIAGSQFASGEKYSDAKCSLILFANYVPNNLNNNIDIAEKYVDYKFMNAKHNIVKKDIESYEIILPNFHKMNYNECNEVEKFLWLFSCKSIADMKKVVDNDEDYAIIEELERLNMDDNFRFEYDNEIVQKKLVNSAKKEGFDEGIQEGVQEGIQLEKIRNIKALYKEDIPLDVISKISKLSVDEIKKILNVDQE